MESGVVGERRDHPTGEELELPDDLPVRKRRTGRIVWFTAGVIALVGAFQFLRALVHAEELKEVRLTDPWRYACLAESIPRVQQASIPSSRTPRTMASTAETSMTPIRMKSRRVMGMTTNRSSWFSSARHAIESARTGSLADLRSVPPARARRLSPQLFIPPAHFGIYGPDEGPGSPPLYSLGKSGRHAPLLAVLEASTFVARPPARALLALSACRDVSHQVGQ